MRRLVTLLPMIGAVLSIWATGCSRANPLYCDSQTPCSEGVCDENGSVGMRNECLSMECEALPDVCSADGTLVISCDDEASKLLEVDCGTLGCNSDRASCNECTPSAVVCMDGEPNDTLLTCNADGTIASEKQCFLGCQSGGTASCVDIDPSNGLAEDLDFIDNNPAAIDELILADGYTVQSDGQILDDSGEAIGAVSTRTVSQDGGKPLRIFRVERLTITGTVTVEGDDEVVAFVSNDDIFINGTLLVRSGRIIERTDSCYGRPAAGNGMDRPGSGGGAFGQNGQRGGSAEAQFGGQGGVMHGTDDLQPLIAGCGSRAPVDDAAGGGAIQLVSRTKIQLGSEGILGAVGDGGSGHSIDEFGNVASGGGSGGGVLLEAPEIVIDDGSFISANGGGGGGGCANDLGQSGRLSSVAALGANCVTDPDSGTGGTGGTRLIPTQGQTIAGGTNSSGGGGGGGAGRIRINNATGELPSTSQISPEPALGMIGSR